MSDGGTGEKTEEPTPERLRKLKEEGNVPKSQDVSKALSFIAVFTALALLFPSIQNEMRQLFAAAFRSMPGSSDEFTLRATTILYHGLMAMMKIVLPLLFIEMVLAIAGNVMQFGFVFTTKPLTPDIKKINPINGLKGMFKLKKLVELLKTVIKFSLISYLAYFALSQALKDVVMIVRINTTGD